LRFKAPVVFWGRPARGPARSSPPLLYDHQVPLYLTEDDVGRLLTMDDCLKAGETALRDLAEGRAVNRPRSRAALPSAMLHALPSASSTLARMAAKVYATSRGGARFVVLLFDAATSEVLAIIEGIRRKPISSRVISVIQTGCAAALIMFMVYIAFYDVQDLPWKRGKDKDKPADIRFAPKPAKN